MSSCSFVHPKQGMGNFWSGLWPGFPRATGPTGMKGLQGDWESGRIPQEEAGDFEEPEP